MWITVVALSDLLLMPDFLQVVKEKCNTTLFLLPRAAIFFILIKDESITGQLKALIGGVCIGYSITVIIFILYAIILTYTNISDKGLDVIVILTTILSVIVAGYDSVKNSASKGLLWGVLAGLLYSIILVVISTLIDGNLVLNGETIITIAVATASGGIGGVIGINKK